MTKTTPRCDSCMYWKRSNSAGGECRRYPPWIECTDKSSWPMTVRDDFCGEWEEDYVQI